MPWVYGTKYILRKTQIAINHMVYDQVCRLLKKIITCNYTNLPYGKRLKNFVIFLLPCMSKRYHITLCNELNMARISI
uniref:Uncharacterized protein n=1 Tax=Arundo donax TaxID=35708 RepID=A0A0A9AJ33_ARUDO